MTDPWSFATSEYERAKYLVTLAALSKQHYSSALEVGCSIGVFTLQLADRCHHLLAVDAAAAPLAQARLRCAGLPGVEINQGFIPSQWPDAEFDLILLSEIIYYLSPDDIARLSEHIERTLLSAGEIVLVNWTGETGTSLSGDDAAELLIQKTSDFADIVTQERGRIVSTGRAATVLTAVSQVGCLRRGEPLMNDNMKDFAAVLLPFGCSLDRPNDAAHPITRGGVHGCVRTLNFTP